MIIKNVFKAPGSVRPFHTLTLIYSMWVNGSINYSSANIYSRINTAFGRDPNEFSAGHERLTRPTIHENFWKQNKSAHI